MHTHGIFMMLASPHGNKRIGFQKGNFQIIIEIIEKKYILFIFNTAIPIIKHLSLSD
jgi:hypothetical protein